jgi:hypothetical protein
MAEPGQVWVHYGMVLLRLGDRVRHAGENKQFL